MDRNRLIASAQRFLQRGQHDKALNVYNKLLELEPDDPRLMLRVGDIANQAGRKERAIEAYRMAVQHFVSTGFFTKAVGVLKSMRLIAPDDLDLCIELAGLYEQVSLFGDARKYYREVLDGPLDSSNEHCRKIALGRLNALDPDDADIAIQFSRLLVAEKNRDEATSVLRQSKEALREEGNSEGHVQVIEELLRLNPDDQGALLARARAMLERGDSAPAQQLLEGVALHEPDSIWLADLFVEYSVESRGYAGAEAELVAIIKRALAAGDEDHARLLARRVKALRRRAQQPEPSNQEDDAALLELENEADVFLQYRLFDKALAKLDEVLEQQPQRLSALQKRREVLSLKGADPSVEARAWLLEARALAAAGDDATARDAINSAAALAPNDPSVVRALERARSEPSGLAYLNLDELDEPTPEVVLPHGLLVALAGVEESLEAGELDQAIQAVNGLLFEYPSHAELLAKVLEDLMSSIDELPVAQGLADALTGEEDPEIANLEIQEVELIELDSALSQDPDIDLADLPSYDPIIVDPAEEVDDLFLDPVHLDDEEELLEVSVIEVETVPIVSEPRRINPASPLTFSPLEAVIENSPSSPLAVAAQLRRSGDNTGALMMLEMERMGVHPEAAAFESAIASFELGMFVDAMQFLQQTEALASQVDEDLASVRYLQGLVFEALDHTPQALEVFKALEEVFPGRYSDLSDRIKRLS